MKKKWSRPVITILGIEQTETELRNMTKAECHGYYPDGECKLQGSSIYTNGSTFTTADPGYQMWRENHEMACSGGVPKNWDPVLYWES